MKNLFLVAIKNAEDTKIRISIALPPSADWKTKHDAEEALKKIDTGFRESHAFYVVASADVVTSGIMLNPETVDVCFRII